MTSSVRLLKKMDGFLSHNVQVAIMQRLKPCFHAYSDFSLRLVPYRCALKKGEPEALEHQVLRWITPDEISLYDFPEADVPVLREYMALNADSE